MYRQKVNRVTWRSKLSVCVRCEDCDWEYEGANGVGLAAQHCDRHEHVVTMDIYRAKTFVPASRADAYAKEIGRIKSE